MSATRIWIAAALLLGACGGSDEQANRSAEFEVELDDAQNVSNEIGEAPMAWAVGGDPAEPQAIYGPARNDIRFGIRCDREAGEIVVQRASGSDAGTLIIATGGRETSLNAVPTPSGPPRVVARIPLSDPVLQRLSLPGATLSASVPGEEPLILPGGSPIRRVVEACNAPPPERFEGPVFAGTIPSVGEISLTFAQPDAGPGRYRLVRRGGEAGNSTSTGTAEILYQDIGPIYRLTPDGGGEPTWIERPEPGVIVYRSADNQPSPQLDDYPLRRVE